MDILRFRVLPAIVAALGVALIAAGILMYSADAGANQAPFPSDAIGHPDAPISSPTVVALPSEPAPTDPAGSAALPSASGSPTAAASPSGIPPTQIAASPPVISASPSAAPTVGPASTPTASARPSTTATPDPTPATTPSGPRVATRVVIPALDIDLPVIRPPGDSTTYPLCNVAMYIQSLSQPGSPGATYIYAHARVGMFLPLLTQSRIDDGRGMLGMLVQVYTSDNRSFLYEISEVRRHQLTLDDAVAAKNQQLWLQTSEGPHGTPGKLQVVATPLSNGPADAQDANPTPHPVVCG